MFIEQLQVLDIVEKHNFKYSVHEQSAPGVKMHALISQLVLAGQPGIRKVLPQENSGGTGKLQPKVLHEEVLLPRSQELSIAAQFHF